MQDKYNDLESGYGFYVYLESDDDNEKSARTHAHKYIEKMRLETTPIYKAKKNITELRKITK